MMKRKYIILLVILLLIYPLYRGWRNWFWVTRDSFTLDGTMNIRIEFDPSMIGYIDHPISKKLWITNLKTNAQLNIAYESIEWPVYFFIDTIGSEKLLLIVDKFKGRGLFDYNSLADESKETCLTSTGSCAGYDDSGIKSFGKPILVYDQNGFHR